MPTEPLPPTLSEVVRRAVEVCDPAGEHDAVADFLRSFEDRDEPVAAIEDVESLAFGEVRRIDPDGDDPALTMAAAVTVYLGFRRDELSAPDEELLRLAARGEFDGKPPPPVADWLRERGVDR